LCHHSWPIKVGIKQPTAATRPYMTRAAIRPDRRLQTSHPGGSGTPSGGRRRKTPLRTPAIAKRVEPSEASTQNRAQVFVEVRPWRSQAASKLLRSYLPPEQHEADGCRLPASSTGPRRATDARAAPRLAVSSQKRLRKNGLSERRRVPRGESEGLVADRHRPWSKLAGLSDKTQA